MITTARRALSVFGLIDIVCMNIRKLNQINRVIMAPFVMLRCSWEGKQRVDVIKHNER